MAYDGEGWSLARELARARAAADEAERAWLRTSRSDEDPYGPASSTRRDPLPAEAREAFRRAWADYVRLRDEAAELAEAEEAPLAA